MSELQNLVAELTTWETDQLERLITDWDNGKFPVLLTAARMVYGLRSAPPAAGLDELFVGLP